MSRNINLSFVQNDPFSIKRWSWLSVCLMIISLFVTFNAGFVYLNDQNTLFSLHEKLEQINLSPEQSRLANLASKDAAKDIKLSPAQTKQIEETIDELVIAWDLLFLSIEQSLIDDIALLEISPNSKKKQIVLRGEAKNLKAVFAYIKSLDDTAVLSKVYLQTHSVDDTNVSKPVSFTLSAEWLLRQSVNHAL